MPVLLFDPIRQNKSNLSNNYLHMTLQTNLFSVDFSILHQYRVGYSRQKRAHPQTQQTRKGVQIFFLWATYFPQLKDKGLKDENVAHK